MTATELAPWLSTSRWPTVPIRYVAKLGTGHTPSRQKPEYWKDCTLPWITLADVWQLRDSTRQIIKDTKEKISYIGLANSAAVLHPTETVILSRTASVGFSAILGADMATSQDFATWTCSPRLLPKFLLHALRAMAPDLRRVAAGSTHKTIYMPDIEQLRIPLPPIEEQWRIADFLDAEIARLSKLAVAHKEQMNLISERWEVIVRREVTGNHNRKYNELQHPDLAWLGPSSPEWTSARLGRVSATHMGTTFPHSYQGQSDGDFPFIKVADFANSATDGTLTGAMNWITREVARKLGARIVPKDSILYARVGAAMLLNRRGIAGTPCVIDDNIRGIQIRSGSPRYWKHLLSLLDLGGMANPGPVPSISEAQISAVRVPLPPHSEQFIIAARIDDQQIIKQNLENALRRQIRLLTERQQALITAAVTGQIDVSTASGRGVG